MSNVSFKFDLGTTVKDTVSGFSGIIVGQHQWLTGCATYSVQPPVDKDGKIPDTVGFDENRLEEVKAKAAPKSDRTKGGPHDTPSRRTQP